MARCQVLNHYKKRLETGQLEKLRSFVLVPRGPESPQPIYFLAYVYLYKNMEMAKWLRSHKCMDGRRCRGWLFLGARSWEIGYSLLFLCQTGGSLRGAVTGMSSEERNRLRGAERRGAWRGIPRRRRWCCRSGRGPPSGTCPSLPKQSSGTLLCTALD